jgi:hypothetical protein
MEMPVMETPKKDNKTWAIVGTVAAILLCGCPGLSLCLFGAVTAFGAMPDFFNGYGELPNWIGFASLCVALIFVAIAVVVPILLLKKKKSVEVAVDIASGPQEPLPPAS